AEETSALPFVQADKVVWQKRHLGEVTHIFSHLKWHVLLFYGRLPKNEEDLSESGKQTQWLLPTSFEEVVFPKVQMKLVQQLDKNRNNSNPF
ncbi:A/G-specific adenine glycosylase, partial [Enterococcus sp. DIV1271a]|nr:A/G-specific adenine glycosylase [Enterococcus sp. DIV1271a]